MTDFRNGELPDFSNPPVAETVLSVQFEPPANFRAAHLGLFWREIQDRFPKTEERRELPSVIEEFPEVPKLAPGIQIQLQQLEVPPMPRYWFVNHAGKELIQLQKDRFVKNWRKIGEGDQYPRYENVKAGFEKDFALFREFVRNEKLGELQLNQCEVTYVNHIMAGEGWTQHAEIDKVFVGWRQPELSYPGAATDVTWTGRFLIADEGKPVGRLHVEVLPVSRAQDGKPMFVMSLTARGQLGPGLDFFDLGRQWIVWSFKNLTTPEMHRIWGIRN
jgi:uncharacterized protein (TIGR04255 family)